MNDRKVVHVSAAVILRDSAGSKGKELFTTQRGHGEYKDYWEFPGGKIEPGETPEEALVREIREELGIGIGVDEFFHHVEFDYPGFHLSMECFLCHIEEEPRLLEHEDARWLPLENLRSVMWLPADDEVLAKLENMDK